MGNLCFANHRGIASQCEGQVSDFTQRNGVLVNPGVGGNSFQLSQLPSYSEPQSPQLENGDPT